ncbi:MAG: MarR family transcriptional regulator [Alphaproteobacteria bacterium]|nr:MarR family transcriptional regulator [Alphaproteobacteria bacterium]
MKRPRKATPDLPLDALYRRPGFMLRRAHQIAVALFLEETGALRVTTTQFGILHLLKHQPGLDQISVAKLLGLDRSTTGMVLKSLEARGLIGRSVGMHDRRKRTLALTRDGEHMLARLKAPASRVIGRQLAAFAPRERKLFLQMLEKFVRAFNESTRVPLEAHRVAKRKGRGKD